MELEKTPDPDARESAEWVEAFEQLLKHHGEERARHILRLVLETAHLNHVDLPEVVQTPYVNTIPVAEQPPFPGDEKIEKRIRAIIRWNAAVMVVRANHRDPSLGGHLSTYASAATLFEVGFNHFFRGRRGDCSADQVFYQGHASPGIYARAFVEGRLREGHLERFRQEVGGGGLSSYPHPWLMPDFWEFPSVSMGLGPLTAIYQARFNRYLRDRGLRADDGGRVWAFVGDGECDEPESLGSISLAGRERLDNLVFVVNCNLQRLDGPVRGNGKIVQELEAVFRGAGWNVVKVLWGRDWDPLLEADASGLLVKRMDEALDGDFQKYVVEPGSYTRAHFFGKYPETLELVESLSDEQIRLLRRGGHDPVKVYAAYHKAVHDAGGKPTAILAKTVKGWSLGEGAEGLNVSHQVKKFNETQLRTFRDRLGLPIRDQDLADPPYYRPARDSEEMEYLHERRRALGGFVPRRTVRAPQEAVPRLEAFGDLLKGSVKEASTTGAYAALLKKLLADPRIGKRVVPIIPDEARTFGLDALFQSAGIYSSVGQLYEPVDRKYAMYYREAKDGQVLEEGITEAGSMASFTAAGTAYATHGLTLFPFYIYYSMFGYQRVGDLIWAAADARAKGFLLGATAGRTTLNGEGLQHQDGHSLLLFSAVPSVRCYDPAWAYEVALIIHDGLKRMYQDGEPCFYYLTLYNENFLQPTMPPGVEDGVIRGVYLFKAADVKEGKKVQLLGSGPILREALRAQELLGEKFGVAADVWSATSYVELRRDAIECDRWNALHPAQSPRIPYLLRKLGNAPGPVVAVSDYVRAVPDMIARWLPGRYTVLGTDGFGRSDSRSRLRRHFEVDAEHVAYHALRQLGWAAPELQAALRDLGIDPDAPSPAIA